VGRFVGFGRYLCGQICGNFVEITWIRVEVLPARVKDLCGKVCGFMLDLCGATLKLRLRLKQRLKLKLGLRVWGPNMFKEAYIHIYIYIYIN
jgi:hypothetical protein